MDLAAARSRSQDDLRNEREREMRTRRKIDQVDRQIKFIRSGGSAASFQEPVGTRRVNDIVEDRSFDKVRSSWMRF